MCKPKTPKFTPTPSLREAQERQPDNAALYEEARQRANTRSGPRRSTILTGLRGTTTPPVLGAQTGQRMSTVLG